MNTTTDTTSKLTDLVNALGELPHQYDVELVEKESSVYVNFDFDTAVVIEMGDPDQEAYDGMYVLIAMHWDRTHAVDQEHFIGSLADAHVAAAAAVAFAKAAERD